MEFYKLEISSEATPETTGIEISASCSGVLKLIVYLCHQALFSSSPGIARIFFASRTKIQISLYSCKGKKNTFPKRSQPGHQKLNQWISGPRSTFFGVSSVPTCSSSKCLEYKFDIIDVDDLHASNSRAAKQNQSLQSPISVSLQMTSLIATLNHHHSICECTWQQATLFLKKNREQKRYQANIGGVKLV